MDLSNTEYKVCDKIARGFSVKEIAVKMYRSPYTIDTHIKNVKRKNGLKNMADITREFIKSLDRPEDWFKTIIALVFVTLQSFIMFGTDLDDYRMSRTGSRVVRTTRTSKTSRKDTYNG